MDSRVVSRAVQALQAPSRAVAQLNWKRALAGALSIRRPDLADQLVTHLGVEPAEETALVDMSVGELGLVYEALLALSDPKARRSSGQYFTPDDVAQFMVAQAGHFPAGTWLDPCCGIGNLSWHLAAAQKHPDEFVEKQLSLVDMDEVALASAEAILTASFAGQRDTTVLSALKGRSRTGDFLSLKFDIGADFVIMNPPYGRTVRRDGFATSKTRELYAYFLEKVASIAPGFVAITPASFLGGLQYAPLREVLSNKSGRLFVFDNVPDTIFRGYKYGSANTSSTNFVRACITVAEPQATNPNLIVPGGDDSGWMITPIVRWSSNSRDALWDGLNELLVPLRTAPGGEWAKIMPGTEGVWNALCGPAVPSGSGAEDAGDKARCLADLLADRGIEGGESGYRLWVASTPRYYISASKKELKRSSCHVLGFETERAMNQAYLLLNSSIAYWWWRCVDGGITLQKRTLSSVPLPPVLEDVSVARNDLIERLESSDSSDIQRKLNAGRINENVKRPRGLVDAIDRSLLPGVECDFTRVFAPDLFARGTRG